MKPPLCRIPADVVALADYEPLACERIRPEAWAYLAGGAADEITLRANTAAFQRRQLLPRVLRDLSQATTEVSLLGKTLPHPLLVAPMAYHRLFHPEGELATALGAAALQAPLVVSTQASTLLETIAHQAQTPLWFQLYFQSDRGITRELAQRAEAAGYEVLVLTVDAPLSGCRNREQRAGFQLPPDVEAVNLRGFTAPPAQDQVFGGQLLNAAPTWEDLDRLCRFTRLPVILKGILSAADARLAIDHGASGIIVSNHGGRVLDGTPATLDVLPGIAATVAGAIPVLMDGGIRRGTDVFQAIALGADAVMVGRPILHGLAAAGALGVAHVLKILLREFELAMALCGCRSVEEIREGGFLMEPAQLTNERQLP